MLIIIIFMINQAVMKIMIMMMIVLVMVMNDHNSRITMQYCINIYLFSLIFFNSLFSTFTSRPIFANPPMCVLDYR